MRKTNLKELFKQFKEEREKWDYEINNDLLNASYFLAKRDNMPVEDIEDVAIIYDNLEINGEILTFNNIDDWDIEVLENWIGHKEKYIREQFSKGYFYILSYYQLYKDKNGYSRDERVKNLYKITRKL